METETRRILVVDDEPGIREGCRKILAAEGYEVETAEDGVAGLEVFKRGRSFVGALIDLKMPRMGGIELVEEIRKLDEDVVLFVITAYATIATAVDATKRGAYGYIAKPFTPDELMLGIMKGLESRALTLEARRLREERERRLLEVAFERSKSNTILHCLTDAVVVVNRDQQIVLRNAAAASALPGLAAPSPPVPVDRGLQQPDLEEQIEQALRSRDPSAITSREIALGSKIFMANASPVAEPGGEILGAVVVLRDITALKKLEAAKSAFVSMVAHEIRNPLSAIQGYLQAILQRAGGDYPPEDVQMLKRAALRAEALREMLSDLLTVTSIQAGKFDIARTGVDIVPLLERVVESLRTAARDKRIELILERGNLTPSRPVLADPSAMVSVFNNLVDNAIKYTLAGGSVCVRVDFDASFARVTVEDTGIGMSVEEAESVFEEFYRAKNRLAIDIPGTGLGLAIVKRLVEAHQGTITLDSEPGAGSRFNIGIPLVPAP